MLRILIVEDEPSYIAALEVALVKEGFDLAAAADGRAGLAAFQSGAPDVVLLDLMLPGLSGLDVLRRIREQSQVPVIVLSAKAAESDVVTALELGADDYLTKPYSIRELVARIRVAIRRGSGSEEESAVLTVGTAVLDPGRYELRLDGAEAVDLPRKEFEVLQLLMSRPGRVVSREELLDEVWGHGWSDSKSLDQHIRRLRRKLETGADPPVITTVRGVGYRLESAAGSAS
jgi:two-component system response regulator RegX3